jgi:hypothetical protein
MKSLIADLNRASLRRAKARRKKVLLLMTAMNVALDSKIIREDVYDSSYSALLQVLDEVDSDIHAYQVSLGDQLVLSTQRRKAKQG